MDDTENEQPVHPFDHGLQSGPLKRVITDEQMRGIPVHSGEPEPVFTDDPRKGVAEECGEETRGQRTTTTTEAMHRFMRQQEPLTYGPIALQNNAFAEHAGIIPPAPYVQNSNIERQVARALCHDEDNIQAALGEAILRELRNRQREIDRLTGCERMNNLLVAQLQDESKRTASERSKAYRDLEQLAYIVLGSSVDRGEELRSCANSLQVPVGSSDRADRARKWLKEHEGVDYRA